MVECLIHIHFIRITAITDQRNQISWLQTLFYFNQKDHTRICSFRNLIINLNKRPNGKKIESKLKEQTFCIHNESRFLFNRHANTIVQRIQLNILSGWWAGFRHQLISPKAFSIVQTNRVLVIPISFIHLLNFLELYTCQSTMLIQFSICHEPTTH